MTAAILSGSKRRLAADNPPDKWAAKTKFRNSDGDYANDVLLTFSDGALTHGRIEGVSEKAYRQDSAGLRDLLTQTFTAALNPIGNNPPKVTYQDQPPATE